MDLFFNHTKLFTSQYVNLWAGVMWITVMFYQLFGLSFWCHPFVSEDPMMSNWLTLNFSKRRNKRLYILADLRVSTSFVNVHYLVNYSLDLVKLHWIFVRKRRIQHVSRPSGHVNEKQQQFVTACKAEADGDVLHSDQVLMLTSIQTIYENKALTTMKTDIGQSFRVEREGEGYGGTAIEKRTWFSKRERRSNFRF